MRHERSRMERHTSIAVVIAVALLAAPHAQHGGDRWIATWTTANVGRPQVPPAAPAAATATSTAAAASSPTAPAPTASYAHVTGQTLRQIVHTTAAGSQLRVVVSNVFGTAPMTIGAAHVALRDKASAIVPASGRALAFNGRGSVTIPAGAAVVSDAAAIAVPAAVDLAVDLYLPGTTNTPSPTTMHAAAHQTNYVSEAGDFTGKTVLPVSATTESWFGMSQIDVLAQAGLETIVAFGDSITDGSRSTTDANGRWPDILAGRLAARHMPFAVANAGIGGNRLLSDGAPLSGVNALARFDRDVLDVAGVTHAVVLEGINDIGNARGAAAPTADDLIAAHAQLVERAHLRGIRILGATLTPFEGANYYTESGEAKRQAINAWIRTARAYDGVVDFDAAARDPEHPGRLLAAYDSGDHLHPNDAGYKAMGDAVDLALFKAGQTNASGTSGRSKR
jgi:lysophospholipase L1-like esterase